MIWPFRKLTPEQVEDREWKRYRIRLAETLHRQGYRGDPVTYGEAWDWACRYTNAKRQEQVAWRSELSE